MTAITIKIYSADWDDYDFRSHLKELEDAPISLDDLPAEPEIKVVLIGLDAKVLPLSEPNRKPFMV